MGLLPDDLLADALRDFIDGVDADRVAAAPAPAPAAAPQYESIRDICDARAIEHGDDPHFVPWPDSWFTENDVGDARACKELFGEVLLVGLRDVLTGEFSAARAKLAGKCRVSDSWVGTRDFHTVCALAGIDGLALAQRLANPAQRAEMAKRLLDPRSIRYVRPAKAGGA